MAAARARRIKKGDIKYSYYREHTHAIASGVDSGAVMAELFAKDTGKRTLQSGTRDDGLHLRREWAPDSVLMIGSRNGWVRRRM